MSDLAASPTPGSNSPHPLDALAAVNCRHIHHHAMCVNCAADAVRPALDLLRADVSLRSQTCATQQLRGDLGEAAQAELSFVRQVMSLFARADIHSELFWRDEGGQLKLYANVSDVFTWGCADAEDITPERLPVLQQAYGDLAAIGGLEHLAELYGARIRRMRPQGAAYPDHSGVRALFDACGPERDLGLGNPKAPTPLAEPAQRGDTRG